MESVLSVMSVRKCVQGDSVPHIVPRVVVEILPHQHAELLTILRSEAVKALVQECKRSKSDGMVRASLLCLVLNMSAWSIVPAAQTSRNSWSNCVQPHGFCRQLSCA